MLSVNTKLIQKLIALTEVHIKIVMQLYKLSEWHVHHKEWR